MTWTHDAAKKVKAKIARTAEACGLPNETVEVVETFSTVTFRFIGSPDTTGLTIQVLDQHMTDELAERVALHMVVELVRWRADQFFGFERDMLEEMK